jgi:hypothetical protein
MPILVYALLGLVGYLALSSSKKNSAPPGPSPSGSPIPSPPPGLGSYQPASDFTTPFLQRHAGETVWLVEGQLESGSPYGFLLSSAESESQIRSDVARDIVGPIGFKMTSWGYVLPWYLAEKARGSRIFYEEYPLWCLLYVNTPPVMLPYQEA